MLKSVSSLPSSIGGNTNEDARLWKFSRDTYLKPILSTFLSNCDSVDITLGRTTVQTACDNARAAGKPLRLYSSVPGTPFDIGNTVWSPKPNNNSDTLIIFSLDDVEIVGDAAIEVSTNLQLYGLIFRNSSAGTPRKTLAWPSTVAASDVTVIGNKFIPDTPSSAIYASSTQVHQDNIVKFNEFINCSYSMLSFSLYLCQVCDNRSIMPINGGGRHFFRNGGGKFQYLRNYLEGGVTGITGMHDHSTPVFTAYPHMQSFVDDVIDGNVIKYVSEEYIGYDVQTNSSAYHPCLTVTTVTGLEGTGAADPTLLCSWDGASSISTHSPGPYRFAYVLGPVDHPLVGKYCQIRRVLNVGGVIKMELRGIGNGNNGLKSNSGSGLRRGEVYNGELIQPDFANLTNAIISICDLSVGARITNNTLICRGAPNRHTTVISLWGSTVGFMIKDNQFINHGAAPTNMSYHGIRITTVSGIGGKVKAPSTGHCNWGNTQINGKDLVQFPNSFGIVTRNRMDQMRIRMNNATYAGSGDNLLIPYPGIKIYDNYDLLDPNNIVNMWQGTDGIHASNTPCYDNSSTMIYNNS